MKEEDVDRVARELARIDVRAIRQRQEKALPVKGVLERYRTRARIAIQALNSYRSNRNLPLLQDNGAAQAHSPDKNPFSSGEGYKPDVTVICRPPKERRAHGCRVLEIEGSRAYLAPILRACTDWVSIEHLHSAPGSKRIR